MVQSKNKLYASGYAYMYVCRSEVKTRIYAYACAFVYVWPIFTGHISAVILPLMLMSLENAHVTENVNVVL